MPLANIELTSTFDEWRTRTNQLTIQGEKLVLDTSAAYNQANLAFNQANTGYIQANLAFNQANTGYNQANTARNVANAAYAKANATTFTSNIAIVVADNSNAALRITQTGTGLALRVEDAANPDSTPFVVDADGNVGIGTATPTTTLHVAGTANISTSLRLAGTDMITRLNNAGTGANNYCDVQFSILGSVLQTNITGANANAANASFMTTGITAIARGGTGASTPAGARTNLELGNLALFNSVNGTQIVVTSEAQGDILYRNATEWARLPAGTSGQVLKTNGSGANPSWSSPVTFETVKAAGAGVGTVVDFTGIPAGVKRITVIFSNISTALTSDYLLLIGDSEGFETTGYSGAAGTGAATTPFSTTNAFCVHNVPSAAANHSGIATLVNIGGNTWVISGTMAASVTSAPCMFAGSKTLTGTLDRIRFTTVTPDALDGSGTINIAYEY